MDEGVPRFPLCSSDALAEGRHLKLKLLFEGRDEECLLVRFRGSCYAYINRCVHMPRPLDCEKDMVFDQSGQYLRCSMHGIVYTPETGTSVSALCEGERLRAVSIYEENGKVGMPTGELARLDRAAVPACDLLQYLAQQTAGLPGSTVGLKTSVFFTGHPCGNAGSWGIARKRV